MVVTELKPRLWHWTARHPEWTADDGGDDGWEPDVGSYAYVSPDRGTLVLVDPLVPDGDGGEAFWRRLDDDVRHHGPPQVLITVPWHRRSSQAILDRYPGTRVWAHAPAREELEEWTTVTNGFQVGDALPGGIEALDAGGSSHEVAYRIPEHAAVAVGDSLIARPGEPLRVWPDEESVRPALRALLAYPVELLLLTHGEPVLADGGAALARALEA